jgi:hypothetical protein
MRSTFGHFWDAVEGLREIYEGTRERATKRRIIEMTHKLVDLQGDYENLRGFWPEFETLEMRGQIRPGK